MVLSADDAAKFWPIYSEYDVELTKLNDQRVEISGNMRARTTSDDEKADELIRKSLAYQSSVRSFLQTTYDRVKQAVGAITAAALRSGRTSVTTNHRSTNCFVAACRGAGLVNLGIGEDILMRKPFVWAAVLLWR